jgi:hypothetical protein
MARSRLVQQTTRTRSGLRGACVIAGGLGNGVGADQLRTFRSVAQRSNRPGEHFVTIRDALSASVVSIHSLLLAVT